MEEYTVLAEAIELLKKAREELGHHWFSYSDGSEYNNDDTIEVSEDIDEFFERLKEVKGGRQDV